VSEKLFIDADSFIPIKRLRCSPLLSLFLYYLHYRAVSLQDFVLEYSLHFRDKSGGRRISNICHGKQNTTNF